MVSTMGKLFGGRDLHVHGFVSAAFGSLALARLVSAGFCLGSFY